MLKKFSIEYVPLAQHNQRVYTHVTDDPVEAEDFLMQLLAFRARIREIRHEGKALSPVESDHMIKLAAERVMSLLLRESLALDASEIKRRFGFAA